MDSGGRIEKFNSTTINVGNTQATSVDKEHVVAIERCQRESTRLFRNGPLYRIVMTVRRNHAMNKILQNSERDDDTTIKFKASMMFKTITGEAKLPNKKQSILQSNKGISQIKSRNSEDW